jgi:hypothetical protein
MGVHAQENSRLSGRVTNNGEGVADVHILNLSAEKATITDEGGVFSLEASAGDTLLFSAIQLRRKSLIVTAAMLRSVEVVVPLEEFVNQLDEVVVRPYNLSGDIWRDLEQVPVGRVVVASSLGLPNAYVKPPTQAERKLYEATSGAGIVPLNPVLNAITGRTRYLKAIVATEARYAQTEQVRGYYPDSLFTRELQIPLWRIDDFMYYCEQDSLFPDLVGSDDRLRIWEFLKLKSRIYRQNNALE